MATEIKTPIADALREQIKNVLDYPLGADIFTYVGRRYPVEVHTARHGTFPCLVIFDAAVIREARACERDGARVMLTIEVSNDARTRRIAKIERV